MFIRNFEIEHMRKYHPQLLDQIAGRGMYEVEDKTGYELPENEISDILFVSVAEALSDARR